VTTSYTGQDWLARLSTTQNGTTTNYSAGEQRIAQAVNGAFSYLGSDGLGSAQVALDGSGTAQASVLYGPYGATRYASGTVPGSYGYTGQQADAATGLDYYQARYYDAVAGQFTSADSLQDGLNRYAYVGGNPETATDPTGHKVVDCAGDCGGSGGGPPSCTSACDTSGGSTGQSSGCDQKCLARGQQYLNGIGAALAFVNSTTIMDDFEDLLKSIPIIVESITAGVAGDWMAIIQFVSAAVSAVRDMTDMLVGQLRWTRPCRVG
jgi:RHS repeat-associated protein